MHCLNADSTQNNGFGAQAQRICAYTHSRIGYNRKPVTIQKTVSPYMDFQLK
jgi:hypothetical protein